MTIMSMQEIVALLKEQAGLRAEENDEAGVLLEAAELIVDEMEDIGWNHD